MCDEAKLARWAKEGLNRRQFGLLTGVAAVGACAPMGASGNGDITLPAMSERQVSFTTSAGTMDGFFVAPASGPSPAVLFWPDIASLREAKRNMARRLAGRGYAVLVVNPYYRDVAGQQFADFDDWRNNDCVYANDGECQEVLGGKCEPGSDCLDCDNCPIRGIP